eukprot:CAMPEP_0173159958 /NCGR_PEP_ID=MMETSP1105-20130129/17473_1 /TAXON_ID=2985 /ORGANISM="Ochromonas sp., Strain BG-1" /LENGTH=865 /DNA_ID=CAMNT_0014078599 /DNA_START=84 /DNA_END=2677 /DNA_ORIENTATION=-
MIPPTSEEKKAVGRFLLEEAKRRWLHSEENFLVLTIPDELEIPILHELTEDYLPKDGDFFLFRTAHKDVKNDAFPWKLKKDSLTTLQESPMHFSIDGEEEKIIYGIYNKGRFDENFKRRIYKLMNRNDAGYYQISHYRYEVPTGKAPNKGYHLDERVRQLLTYVRKPDLFQGNATSTIQAAPFISLACLSVVDFQPILILQDRPMALNQSYFYITLSSPITDTTQMREYLRQYLKLEIRLDSQISNLYSLYLKVDLLSNQIMRSPIPSDLPLGSLSLSLIDTAVNKILWQNVDFLVEVTSSKLLGSNLSLSVSDAGLSTTHSDVGFNDMDGDYYDPPATGKKRDREAALSFGDRNSYGASSSSNIFTSYLVQSLSSTNNHINQNKVRVVEKVLQSSFMNGLPTKQMSLELDVVEDFDNDAFASVLNYDPQGLGIAMDQPIEIIGGGDIEVMGRTLSTPHHPQWLSDEELVSLPLDRLEALVAEGNKIIMISYLLKKVDKVSSKHIDRLDKNGFNLLHYCCSLDFTLPVIEKLLHEKRASIEDRTFNEGDTPLHVAVSEGHWEIVKYLIDEGADKEALNGDGDNIYEIARKKGHQALLQELEKHYPQKQSSKKGSRLNRKEASSENITTSTASSENVEPKEVEGEKSNIDTLLDAFHTMNITDKIAFIQDNPTILTEEKKAVLLQVKDEFLNENERKQVEKSKVLQKDKKPFFLQLYYKRLRAMYYHSQQSDDHNAHQPPKGGKGMNLRQLSHGKGSVDSETWVHALDSHGLVESGGAMNLSIQSDIFSGEEHTKMSVQSNVDDEGEREVTGVSHPNRQRGSNNALSHIPRPPPTLQRAESSFAGENLHAIITLQRCFRRQRSSQR